MAILSGKFARVVIDTTTSLATHRWSVVTKTDELDVTAQNRVDGVENFIGGIMDADIHIEGYWEETIHDADPPEILPNTYAVIWLYPDFVQHSNRKITIPDAFISSVVVDAEVRGLVKYTLTAKAHGIYYYPNDIQSPVNTSF